MISNKSVVQELAAIMLAKGVSDIVISPGSRNAPLVNTFAGLPDFKAYSLVDERSAAFFALGMAIRLGRPVAIACTSGTAALNYAPAIAEAYYQKVPLLILTADRPKAWTDQGDGQTIKQENIFANYIKKSVNLPQEIHNKDEHWFANRLINEAINTLSQPFPGPVHINLPFAEPLYEQSLAALPKVRIINNYFAEKKLSADKLSEIASIINQADKVMMLVGQGSKNEKLNESLDHISQLKQVITLSETTSNYSNTHGVACIDKILATLDREQEADFAPEVLISIGDAIVSKRIKAFLRRNEVKAHLHINSDEHHPDTYQHLTHSIYIPADHFIPQLAPLLISKLSTYHALWQAKMQRAAKRHQEYMKQCPYSDMLVFDEVFKQIPADYDLHVSNSSPVRYAQLFRHKTGIEHFANRGTSGIDGCTSTAVGAAFADNKPTLLITGDLSFYYDSNGLWNNYLSDKLRIIVVNNGGGNIFRIIPGPSSTEHLEKFYETRHLEKTEGFAQTFGLEYFRACNVAELNENLTKFFSDDLQKPAILEVFTHRKQSPEVLEKYFQFLKED